MISENLLPFDDQTDDDDRRNPPPLETDELQAIKDILHAQAESRRAASANLLRVVVDGNEQAKINLLEAGSINFDLDDSAEMIEVRVVEKEGETILATHLLSFDDLIDGSKTQTVILEGGQKVSFQLAPTTDEYGEIISLNCDVAYAETDLTKRFALTANRAKYTLSVWFENSKPIFKPVAALGLLILFAAFGWIFYQQINTNRPELVKDKVSAPEKQPEQIILAPETEQNNANKLEKSENPLSKRKNLTDKSNQNTRTNNPDTTAKPNITSPETRETAPPKELTAHNENRRILPKRTSNPSEIQRFAVAGNDAKIPEERETRGLNSAERAKSFNQVDKIYLDISGSGDNAAQFGKNIIAEINKNNEFQVETNREFADARLKISIRRASKNDRKVTVEVSLYNADGLVIYPVRKTLKSWKYIGNAENLPRRIIEDLTAAKP